MKFDSKMLPFKTTLRNKVQTSESKRNSEAHNSEALLPPATSRPDSTQGLESVKNHPNVCGSSRKTQLRAESLEPASSLSLPATASLSNTIRWGKNIYGFSRRSKHAAVAVGNAIYSFGGIGSSSDIRYSFDVLDVFVLNATERKKQWKKLSIENSEVNPNQRFGHSAVAHKEFVLIFGGFDTKKEKLTNSTYRLNTKTLKWDKPKVTGSVAAPRWNHSAVVLRNEMIIYGGNGDDAQNDLFSLHLESFRWSTIETKGIPSSIRWGHSATVDNDRFFLIFGGEDLEEEKNMNRICFFDINNKTWTAVETRGTAPSSRQNHCAFTHNRQMYIFGGWNGNYLNDLFCFNPERLEWKEVTPNGEAPSPRSDAGCVALNDQVFIFGGKNLNEENLKDTCVLQM